MGHREIVPRGPQMVPFGTGTRIIRPAGARVRLQRPVSQRGDPNVNVSPSALLVIIVLTTIANLVILIAVSSRSRNRSRRLHAVEGMLASSYVGGGGAGEAFHGPVAEDQEQGGDPPERDEGTPYEEAWVAMEREAYAEASTEAGDGPDTAGATGEADVEGHGDEHAVLEGEARVAGETGDGSEAGEPVIADEPVADPSGNGSLIGRDSLTGLLDSRAFREVLANEDAREQRYGRPATVVVFELDGLSKIIDRLGSTTGDRIEVALADTIARLARRADYVTRLEPGRYGVLLPETDEVAAINYVERIRRACDLWLESGAIAMRLAIGWASTGGDIQLAAAIRTATDRMRVELRRNARAVGDEDGAGEATGDAMAEAVGVGESDDGSNGR
jgi:diguanylate cyclase (GGDEF)-like protein